MCSLRGLLLGHRLVDDPHDVGLLHDEEFLAVDLDLPNSTRSPTLTSMGMSLPASSRPPGPTAMTSPCDGFSLAVSGMMMPPADFSSASMRLDDNAVVKRTKLHGVLLRF